uniref:Uncharacterized protein n=1 Tax=Neospora caninum (strain Liverpool) TaxID=572307 RepID=A0A0F7UI38_NEOCL|nr:TPA: hypothetical protein BN1204_053790 [Neospora caninum Liverpool]
MDGHSKPLARVLAPFLASLLFFTIAALARTSIAAAGIVEAVTERGLPSEETVSPVISPREGTSIPPSAVAAAPEPALLRLSPTRLQKNIIVGEYTSASEMMTALTNGAELTSESTLFEEKPLWLLYALKDSLVTERILQTRLTALCKSGSITGTPFRVLSCQSVIHGLLAKKHGSDSRRFIKYHSLREGRTKRPRTFGIHVSIQSIMNHRNRQAGFRGKKSIPLVDREGNYILGHQEVVDHFLKKERDDGDLPGYFATVSGLACRAAVESFLRAYKETRFAEESLAPNGGVEQHRATWISDLLPSTRVKRKFSLMKQQGRIFLTDVRLMNIIFHIKAVTARLLRGWSGQRLFKNQAASFGYSVTCRNDCANEITKHLSESHVAPTTTRKALKTDRDFATTVSCVQNDWRHTILWNTGC